MNEEDRYHTQLKNIHGYAKEEVENRIEDIKKRELKKRREADERFKKREIKMGQI